MVLCTSVRDSFKVVQHCMLHTSQIEIVLRLLSMALCTSVSMVERDSFKVGQHSILHLSHI